MSKKVLIITYFFPPRQSIASRRLYGLAKYIQQFDWEPVILTVKMPRDNNNEFEILETDYPGDLEELISFAFSEKYSKNKFLQDIFEYPDKFINWKKRAIKKAFEFIENEKIDAIISSSGPETTHLIASELKKRYNIPWLADMRDLWTQNFDYKKNLIRKYFETKLEKRIFKKANAISLVSEPYAELQSNFLGGKKVYILQNGFDPVDIAENYEVSTEKLTFIYTGMLYNTQDPEYLFEAISELINEEKIDKNKIEIKFFGAMPDNLHGKADKFNLRDIISFGGNLIREDSVIEQRNAQILLYFQLHSFKGIYSGKIFEYLAAQRPILVTGGEKDVVAKLLEETKAGVHIVEKEELKRVLVEYYQEFLEKGRVSYHGISEEINKYSYIEMARKFADILNEISGENKID